MEQSGRIRDGAYRIQLTANSNEPELVEVGRSTFTKDYTSKEMDMGYQNAGSIQLKYDDTLRR